jgi:hypothetical protein
LSPASLTETIGELNAAVDEALKMLKEKTWRFEK